MFNSIMNVFIILSFTTHMTAKERAKTIKKSMYVAAFAVAAFAIIGKFLLDNLNVTIAAMKFTGALLIGPSAYETVVGHSLDETKKAKADLHFFPIGVPTLAGPGVFTTVFCILKQSSMAQMIPVICGIVVAMYATYLVINFGNKLFSNVSPTYMRLISVFFGTMLLALACQFFVDAIYETISFCMARV
ncbi:MAG: hypothetical protein H6845_00100 [Alphaproteobacteria bacterium]|nr:MAG: hypothetical protein H6845_00100 [Alphaproteobacteria bacterium]